jgi:hypothetical protein
LSLAILDNILTEEETATSLAAPLDPVDLPSLRKGVKAIAKKADVLAEEIFNLTADSDMFDDMYYNSFLRAIGVSFSSVHARFTLSYLQHRGGIALRTL